jgi:hypothetical protein
VTEVLKGDFEYSFIYPLEIWPLIYPHPLTPLKSGAQFVRLNGLAQIGKQGAFRQRPDWE